MRQIRRGLGLAKPDRNLHALASIMTKEREYRASFLKRLRTVFEL